MRRKIIAGNWKMNLTASEAQDLTRYIATYVQDRTDPLVIIFPPYPYFSPVNYEINMASVELGAQNVHSEENGAFTGEVSQSMLIALGCTYVIIGHSERRAIFGESDEFINAKLKRVTGGSLTPVLCIGETLEEREQNITNDRIKQQIEDDLDEIEISNGHKIVIAYEPVWAIGTGKNATPRQAEDVHAFIRGLLSDKYGSEIADDISILYGGSVKPDNAVELLSNPNIDGALVGGASLTPDLFIPIIQAAE
ncbi:triose-phosphate isomerase [candidate division KSB1 bacterium]